MSRKTSPTLTDAEVRLMEVLWTRGPATVAEVAKALPGRQAYTTVLTVLRVLENKGQVRHTLRGRAYVYAAVVDRQQARHRAIDHVLARFFNDSPRELMLSFLASERIEEAELRRLRKLISNTKRKPK